MPIQIIPEKRNRSTGEMFSEAFSNVGNTVGNGIGQYLQGQQAAQLRKSQQDETARFIEQMTGKKITGREDPELLKALAVQASKNQAKNELWEKKQGYFDNFLNNQRGGNQGRPNQMDQFDQGEEASSLGGNMQNAQMQGMDQGNQGGFDATQMSDAEIAQARLFDRDFGQSLEHSRDVGLREKREERNFQERQNDKLEKIDEKHFEEVGEAPEKAIARASFNTLVNAVLSGEQDPGSQADFGRMTGIKAWETPGSAAAATGAKEFLISSLDSIRGRPNQFLEQQIQKSLTETGLPRSSNAAKLRVVKFGIDAKDKYDQIRNQLKDSGKYPKGKFKSAAQKEFKKWEATEQKKFIKDLKDITKGNYRSLDEPRYIETQRSKLENYPGFILIETKDGKVGGWKEEKPLPPGAKKI